MFRDFNRFEICVLRIRHFEIDAIRSSNIRPCTHFHLGVSLIMLTSISSGSCLLTTRIRRTRTPIPTRERVLCRGLGSKTKLKEDSAEGPQTTEKASARNGLITGVVTVGTVVALSAIFKDEIQQFLQQFVSAVEGMGVAGYFSYAGTHPSLHL